MAWLHYCQASAQDRDQGNIDRMLERLQVALPLLREKTSFKIAIEILLALAEGVLRLNDPTKANDLLAEAEQLLNTGKYYWYRPTLFMLKARLAFQQSDFKSAAQHIYKGLGMVGDQGDPQMLSPLYRLLAIILQHERSEQDSVMNALERAMAAGRSRARCLDLALALKEAGNYVKATAMRPTARARGSGFLFEAENMLTEMGIIA
jgi:hypothetical protein